MVVLEVPLVVLHNVQNLREVQSVTDGEVLGNCSESAGLIGEETDIAINIREDLLIMRSFYSFKMLLDIYLAAHFPLDIHIYFPLGDDEHLVLVVDALIG